MSRFHVNLPQNQIRKMDSRRAGGQASRWRRSNRSKIGMCSALQKYLEPLYAEGELAAWAQGQIRHRDRSQGDDPARPAGTTIASLPRRSSQLIETRAREAYARREMEYPVDHMLAFTFGQGDGQTGGQPVCRRLRPRVGAGQVRRRVDAGTSGAA